MVDDDGDESKKEPDVNRESYVTGMFLKQETDKGKYKDLSSSSDGSFNEQKGVYDPY